MTLFSLSAGAPAFRNEKLNVWGSFIWRIILKGQRRDIYHHLFSCVSYDLNP
jgi:hypothetical protein